jgi:hypothetical protein
MVRPVIAAIGGLALLVALVVPNATAATSDGRTRHYDAGGLDSCNAPTHPQMAAFWHQTRWWWWGIYIGGVNRACPNTNLTARWVSREVRRGWGLEPIWVGLQAPCVSQSGLARISFRRYRAHQQGRQAARRASAAVQRLGLNTPAPVVYDMEAFDTGNQRCVAAVKAFVRGWSYQLRVRSGLVPGYYGSSCASADSEMWTINPRPSYLWGANYRRSAKVSRMSCVAPDIWPHRLKQYSGGSRVTENGVTLSVDKDCANGPVYGPRRHDLGDCT